MLNRHGLPADAIALYSQALAALPETDSRRGMILLNRAIALDHAGKVALAEADLVKSTTLIPDDPLALNYLGYFWVSHNEHLEDARALLVRAYALQPEDPAIADSLGWADYALGNYKQAVAMLETAVIGAPADSTLNAHLGDAYWRVGRKLEAHFQWNHARDLGPEPEDKDKILDKIEHGLPDLPKPAAADAEPPKSGTPTPAAADTEPGKSGG
jgi:Flp pilus assembly protein TadD